MKISTRTHAARGIARAAWVVLLLSLPLVAPSPARAQDPEIGCPPFRTLSVGLGQGLPLPVAFSNPTDYTVTFTIQDNSPNLFNFPSPLVDPHYGRIVLPPHTNRLIADHAFPIPPLTSIGSDRLVLDVFATGNRPPVYKVWGPFKCDYNLTIVPPSDFVEIPVRWCAVEGSPQAKGVSGPAGNNGAFRTVPAPRLLEMLQILDDQVYFPLSHVLLRHARAPQGIPVIDDPDGTHGPEIPGEFEIDLLSRNLANTGAQCEQAWSRLYPGQRGTVLVNATILDAGHVQGATPSLKNLLPRVGPLLCNFPAKLPVDALDGIQRLATYDPDFCPTGRSCPVGKPEDFVHTLGHEIGHSLGLGHGDGLDNNGDGSPAGTVGKRLYDGYCDPRGVDPRNDDFPYEDEGTTAKSLMDYTGATTISPLQRESVRSVGKLVPGATFTDVNDPAGWLIAPRRACEPGCTLPGDLFLIKTGFAETPTLATTAFTQTLRGPLPDGATNEYLTFVDLDADSATGCDPAKLFPDQPGFAGAELVSRVTVTAKGGIERAVPTLWRCVAGTLSEVVDPGVEARIFAPGVTDLKGKTGVAPISLIVSLSLPDALRGEAGPKVRLQAVARRAGGEVDRLPASGHGEVIDLIPPALPVCTFARAILPPGGRTTVRASGLSPNRPAEVWVAGTVVATGTTDQKGEVAIDFTVPATSRRGYRPVAVILPGGAESANCPLLVEGDAIAPERSAAP